MQGELKQAKQQSQDLRQTDDFLAAIMKPGYLEKEKAVKPASFENNAPRQLNGRPKMPRVDSFSRFSEPPAPPPSQPLPEKPDAPPRTNSDAFSPLKRSDTEKQKPVSTSSPVSRDSSQILSLIEALSSAKKEIDTQGARVKELEELLRQERTARESAEEKARLLEARPALEDVETKVDREAAASSKHTSKTPTDSQNVAIAAEPNGSVLTPDVSGGPDTQQSGLSVVNPIQLQRRVETMVEEMEGMKKQLASYKERAEAAEDESSESRKTLAEMIETLRQERAERDRVLSTTTKTDIHGQDGQDPLKTISEHTALMENGTAETRFGGSSAQHLNPIATNNKELDDAATALAKQWHRRKFMEDASPYASMVGVVLLGVGLMAYLNGWQKLDK